MRTKILSKLFERRGKLMQYIKNYSLELYNKILALQKQENRETVLLKIVNKMKRMLSRHLPLQEAILLQEYTDEIINIACEFMKISKDEYCEVIKAYKSGGKNLLLDLKEDYENQKQTDVFWASINKEWLCLNIYIQSTAYVDIYRALNKIPLNNLTALDYGCGSGVFAILLHKKFNFKKLVLADIENYAANFIKYYISKTNSNEIVWENILEYHFPNETFDFIECFDVLEHLEDSYQQLLRLDSKLSGGGYLALKIAFEIEDKTHLPQAAEGFFVKNDGLSYLKQKYKRIKYFGQPHIVNGIYKKKG